MYTKTKQKGFTLVETLIYIAGAVIVIGMIVSMLYYAYSWYGRVSEPSRVDQIGSALVNKLLGDIRGGQSIDLPQSSFATNNGTLTIDTLTPSLTNVIKHYALQNGRIIYQENSGDIQYLTPSDITVSQFYLNQATTTVSSAIRFSVNIDYLTKTGTSTNTYSGMAILRNSYQ